jgi:hypothetical protein
MCLSRACLGKSSHLKLAKVFMKTQTDAVGFLQATKQGPQGVWGIAPENASRKLMSYKIGDPG